MWFSDIRLSKGTYDLIDEVFGMVKKKEEVEVEDGNVEAGVLESFDQKAFNEFFQAGLQTFNASWTYGVMWDWNSFGY